MDCECVWVSMCVCVGVWVCVSVPKKERENGHGTYADDYWTVTFIGPDRTPKKQLPSFSFLSQQMKKKRQKKYFLISNWGFVCPKLCLSLYFALVMKEKSLFASHTVNVCAEIVAQKTASKWFLQFFCIFTAAKKFPRKKLRCLSWDKAVNLVNDITLLVMRRVPVVFQAHVA